MENDEKEDSIERMMKSEPKENAFNRIKWIPYGFFTMGVVWPSVDFIVGQSIDWRQAAGFFVFGIVSLLVYAIIGRVVERSGRFSTLDEEEKDEKKWKLFYGVFLAFFASILIVCGILS